jgi:hypothetical protein
MKLVKGRTLKDIVTAEAPLPQEQALWDSGGIRYEAQTHAKDYDNVMPRLGITWAPFTGGQTTLRASWGIFHDWFSMNTYEQTLRVDGVVAGAAAAVGAVLVERQADLVAADLHVALFEHVEESHLDARGEVGQLVDREDAAVGARHETIMYRFLIGKITPFGHFDRIDFTHQIGNGNIGGCQFFAVSGIAIDPLNRRVIAQLLKLFATGTANRMVRIVVDFTALNDWNAFIQQVHQAANDARLALSAFSEEDHMVSRQDGVFYFRNDRLIVAHDPRQNPFSGF